MQNNIAMNQILITKTLIEKEKNKFKVIFILSIVFIIVFILSICYSIFVIKKSENNSDYLIGNYNIYKLYSNNSNDNNDEVKNLIFGTIEIPKININYPVFSDLSDENLKISPCKFYGPNINEFGNICIAGHNYDNNKFFSNLKNLDLNDNIFLYNTYNQKYAYIIYQKYEVKENDLSPIFKQSSQIKELTLVTCNNINHNRLILKAKQTQK